MLTNVMIKSKIYNLRNRKNPLLTKIKNPISPLKSFNWRRGRDSNPRDRDYLPTRFRVERFRPGSATSPF